MYVTARAVLVLLCLAFAGLSPSAPAAEVSDARRQAAEQLFSLPTYRQLASRQVYEALRSLPEGQYQSAVEAMSDPKVVKALREVIVRSMAQTFTVPELESLRRYLATDEARSTVEKTDAFQAALLREMLTGALTDPDLGRILAPR